MGKSHSSNIIIPGIMMSHVSYMDNNHIFFTASEALYHIHNGEITELISYTQEMDPIGGIVELPAITELCPPFIVNERVYSGYYIPGLNKTTLFACEKDGRELYKRVFPGQCFWLCGGEQYIFALYLNESRGRAVFRVLDVELNCLRTIDVFGRIEPIVMTVHKDTLLFRTTLEQREILYQLDAEGTLKELHDLGPLNPLNTNYRIVSCEDQVYLQKKVTNRLYSGSDFLLFETSSDGTLNYVRTLHMGNFEEQESCFQGTFTLTSDYLIYVDGICSYSLMTKKIRIWSAPRKGHSQNCVEYLAPCYGCISVPPVILDDGTIYALWWDDNGRKWISSYKNGAWNIKRTSAARYIFGCGNHYYICAANSSKRETQIQGKKCSRR